MPGRKDPPAIAGADDITVRNFRLLVAMVQAHGLDLAAFLAEIGIKTEDLFDSSARAPISVWYRAWERAVELTGLPDLGTRTAGSLDERTVQVLSTGTEYLMIRLVTNSATLREGLQRAARYFGVSDASFDTRFTTDEDGVGQFRFRPTHGKAVPPACTEYAVTLLLRLVLGAVSRPVAPAAVLFPHPRQSAADSYEHALRVTPRFESGELGFDFASADLDVTLRTAQPTAMAELEARGQELLASRAAAATWSVRVRNAVADELASGGNLQIASVSARLGVSSRSLARHLQGEGSSFQTVVDGVRAEVARERLAKGQPVKQVATDLGYADTSTFVRAFRRWTGETPSKHRSPKR